MAYSPLPPFTFSFPSVTKEQFNLFHSIDRDLYSQLIHKLGRDPLESMQVMGFWLWLEQECKDMSLVKRLLTLPLNLLNEVVEESFTCIKCVQSDILFSEDTKLFFLSKLLGRGLALKHLHENRISVVRGITMNVNNVCVRAFEDIIQTPIGRYTDSPILTGTSGTGVYVSPFLSSSNFNPSNVVLKTTQSVSTSPSLVPQNTPLLTHNVVVGEIMQAHDTRTQCQTMSNYLSEMFSYDHMRMEEDTDVPPEDRTIFLTFSKGYPISEYEVRDFFTRKYGDFIEAIHMQEVSSPDEQALYARLTSKSVSILYDIIGGGRAKYSINGKHVWARKYTSNQHSRSPLPEPGPQFRQIN